MFPTQLREGLVRCGLQRQKILLAVSGGADSVALLVAVRQLQADLELEVHVAHLDHCLRDESAADAAWVVNLCSKLNIPVTAEARPIRSSQSPDQPASTGIEESARRLRYEFLTEVATRNGCSAIVTAHHADDQVETVLHHFVRGTGVAGLRGMQSTRNVGANHNLVRPMLAIDRKTIDAYLVQTGQTCRLDQSNTDCSLTRNRIRHKLLPLLESEYNPGIRNALLRLSQQAVDIELMLNELADASLAVAILEETATVCRIQGEHLSKLPDHLVRHCFVRLWTRLDWPRRKMGFNEWKQLANCCQEPKRFDLPAHVHVSFRGRMIVLERDTA